MNTTNTTTEIDYCKDAEDWLYFSNVTGSDLLCSVVIGKDYVQCINFMGCCYWDEYNLECASVPGSTDCVINADSLSHDFCESFDAQVCTNMLSPCCEYNGYDCQAATTNCTLTNANNTAEWR